MASSISGRALPALYRCYAARPVPLATLIQIAGWTVENFQVGKGLVGLDQHQVRRWASWYRWGTLAMLATAFLTITAATENPPPGGYIPLTRNELCRLLATVITAPARHATRCAGPPGAGATSTAPGPASTSDNPPPNNEDHDLQPEY